MITVKYRLFQDDIKCAKKDRAYALFEGGENRGKEKDELG